MKGTGLVPVPFAVPGSFGVSGSHARVRERASGFLRVRSPQARREPSTVPNT